MATFQSLVILFHGVENGLRVYHDQECDFETEYEGLDFRSNYGSSYAVAFIAPVMDDITSLVFSTIKIVYPSWIFM